MAETLQRTISALNSTIQTILTAMASNASICIIGTPDTKHVYKLYKQKREAKTSATPWSKDNESLLCLAVASARNGLVFISSKLANAT